MGKRVGLEVIHKATQSVYRNWLAILGLEDALTATSELHKMMIEEMKRRQKLEDD